MEHRVPEGIVVQEEVVVVVFDLWDGRVVDDAEKPGFERQGESREDEGEQEEQEERGYLPRRLHFGETSRIGWRYGCEDRLEVG